VGCVQVLYAENGSFGRCQHGGRDGVVRRQRRQRERLQHQRAQSVSALARTTTWFVQFKMIYVTGPLISAIVTLTHTDPTRVCPVKPQFYLTDILQRIISLLVSVMSTSVLIMEAK
jgi:hypothetical protein